MSDVNSILGSGACAMLMYAAGFGVIGKRPPVSGLFAAFVAAAVFRVVFYQ